MVNKIDKKKSLLTMLKENECPVSGELLSKQLKISRVAIWKHIQSLQKIGYKIKSNHNGYLLNLSEDLLFPWEIPETGFKINYFAETDSTMTIAKMIAEKEYSKKEIIIAEKQKKGKGRCNRHWTSTDGGLYFTLVLKPDIPAVYSYLYNFAAAITVAKILNEHYSIPASVKWPNDVLVENKKIAGILLEMKGESDRLHFLNIGIGININNKLEDETACSILSLKKRKIPRKEVFCYFVNSFKNIISDIFSASIVQQWKHYSSTLGKKVKINSINKTIIGTAFDIGPAGSLLIKNKYGKIIPVVFGDCFHL